MADQNLKVKMNTIVYVCNGEKYSDHADVLVDCGQMSATEAVGAMQAVIDYDTARGIDAFNSRGRCVVIGALLHVGGDFGDDRHRLIPLAEWRGDRPAYVHPAAREDEVPPREKPTKGVE